MLSISIPIRSIDPQPDEMRSIFALLGLGGDFWDPQFDTFG
jgi:hypothetical protein